MSVNAYESTADWLTRGSTHPHVIMYLMCADLEELSLTKVSVAYGNLWLGCKERGHGLCEEQQLLQRLSQKKIGRITRPAFEPVMRHLSLLSLLSLLFVSFADRVQSYYITTQSWHCFVLSPYCRVQCLVMQCSQLFHLMCQLFHLG